VSLIGGIVFKKLKVLKSVNKLCFEQNNKKVDKFSLFINFFKGLQNLGKYFKPHFPNKVRRSNAFS